MKKTITIIALIATIAATSLNAQEAENNNRRAPADVAQQLLEIYDWDASGALDELELCTAVDYLKMKRPFVVLADPDLSNKREPLSSPKVAVTMRETFDLDEDYQLGNDELAVAIAGMRGRGFGARSLLAQID